MLRQVAAVEADGLVRVLPVIVVPVEQCTRGAGGQLQAYMAIVPQMSTSQALGSRLLLIMLITVQGTTPKYVFKGGPALNGTDSHLCLLHPSFDHGSQLRHLHERFAGTPLVGT